jgi:hypothetical protein
VDYGHDLVATAINVTSGIAEGAIRGALQAEVDLTAIGQAALAGTVDSIHVVSNAAMVQPSPIVEGAGAGFQRGLDAVFRRGINSLEDDDPNRDILGGPGGQGSTSGTASTGQGSYSKPNVAYNPVTGQLEIKQGNVNNTLQPSQSPTGTPSEKPEMSSDVTGVTSSPRTTVVQHARTKEIEIIIENAEAFPVGVEYVLYKDGQQVAVNTEAPRFNLETTQPTEQSVGVYSIQVRDPVTLQTQAALPTTFTLQNTNLPPVSPSE